MTKDAVLHSGHTSPRLGRAALRKTLDALLSQPHGRRAFALILFSIDHFKLVNTRFGDDGADAVLARVAAMAKAHVGAQGHVGRWSADEFLCLLPDAGLRRARTVAEALREDIESLVVRRDDAIIRITGSFGVANCPRNGRQVRALLTLVDEALVVAKQTGRNRVVAAADLDHLVFPMGDLLESALLNGRIVPAYQPIVDLRTGEVVAKEALARLLSPDGRVIAAERFIAAAMQFDLVQKIDRTISTHVFMRRGPGTLPVFINMSAGLLQQPHCLEQLLAESRYGDAATARVIVLEMTERELLGDLAGITRRLRPLLDLGLRLALDDFGSGYSSFHYLADLPVGFLKIDGELVRRLDEQKARALVRGIQKIADELQVKTVAEHVETEWQATILRETGVQWAQGYFFGKPKLERAGMEAARRAETVRARC